MAHWVTTTTYMSDYTHICDFHFICPVCGKDSGKIAHKFHAIYELALSALGYNNKQGLCAQDETAVNRVARNKALVMLRSAYHDVNKDKNFNFLGAVFCPHCGEAQIWKAKKAKLFGPKIPIEDKYLPQIDWHVEKILPDIPDYLLRFEETITFTKDTDVEKLIEKGCQLNCEMTFDVVLPGMHDWMIRDLTGDNYKQITHRNLANLPNTPILSSGEYGYGYFGYDSVWWIMTKNGTVVRTEVKNKTTK